MRSRGLVVVLALVLATLATAGVFLYARGVKTNAEQQGNLTTVIVSKVNIPANSDLNTFIRDGQFTELKVSSDALVQNAVTQISQLQDKRNSVPIVANEQIPTQRIQGEGAVPGGSLGIPDGYEALTVALDSPRAIAGVLSAGDNVTIYATFTGVEIVKINKKTGLPGGPAAGAAGATGAAGGGAGASSQAFDTTVVLVPQVEVLRVILPRQPGGTTGSVNAETGNVTVTLAFLPEDAQKFVFAQEQGKVYLGLLPPGGTGVAAGPITAQQILGLVKLKK